MVETGDNEVKPGDMHRYPGIYLMAEKTPRKFQLGDHLMKSSQTIIATNGTRYLQIISVRSNISSGRREEGRKEGRKELKN